MAYDRQHDIVDFFNHNYSWWDRVYEQQLPRGFFSFEMIRRKDAILHIVRKNVSGQVGLRILECGCGPGGLLMDLPVDEHLVYGLDINLSNLVFVRNQSRQVSLTCGNIEQLPFASGSFDLILCVGVLSYLTGDERAVNEMARLLKPGGHLLIANPNLFMFDKLFDPFYLIVWPFKKLRRIFLPADDRTRRFTTGMIRRYRYRQLDGLYRTAGLTKTVHIGTSFGPIRFWRKECFSLDRSIRISEALVRLSRRNIFEFLARLANHWVTCLEKPAWPAGKGV